MKKTLFLTITSLLMVACALGSINATPTPVPTATPMPRDLTFDEMERQLSEWFEGAEFEHFFDTGRTEMYGITNSGIPDSLVILGKTPNGNVQMVSLAFADTNMETGLEFYRMYLSKYATAEAMAWVEQNLPQITDTNLKESFETPFRTVLLTLGRETSSFDGKFLMVIYVDAE